MVPARETTLALISVRWVRWVRRALFSATARWACYQMDMQFARHKARLENGLTVVTVELPHLHSVSIVMYARVGSRYEAPADNGLSHFLEHMLFRGTEQLPDAYALNHAIEALGGTLYAETGRDCSLYQISLHPEMLSEGLALFAEIFR